jgi:hypothetical protein
MQDALDAPCYPAWLAITGRALITVGRLLQGASPWLESRLQQATAGRCRPGVLHMLFMPVYALEWLCGQVSLLDQHSGAAAAVQLPPELLHELVQLADNLNPKFTALLRLYETARIAGGSSQGSAVAVLRGFQHGSAEGWLHEGLQQLGSKVWAAWPQKYACNDDRCLEMDGLAEQSCSRQCCSGCRVSGCIIAGRYRICQYDFEGGSHASNALPKVNHGWTSQQVVAPCRCNNW